MWLNDFCIFHQNSGPHNIRAFASEWGEIEQKKLTRQWFNINKGKIVEIIVQETLTMIFDSYIRDLFKEKQHTKI